VQHPSLPLLSLKSIKTLGEEWVMELSGETGTGTGPILKQFTKHVQHVQLNVPMQQSLWEASSRSAGQEIPAFYRTCGADCGLDHCTVFWASWIQSTSSYPIYLRKVLICPVIRHQRLGLESVPTITVYVFLIVPMPATCSTHLIFSHFMNLMNQALEEHSSPTASWPTLLACTCSQTSHCLHKINRTDSLPYTAQVPNLTHSGNLSLRFSS
jgi:hypothetical protein